MLLIFLLLGLFLAPGPVFALGTPFSDIDAHPAAKDIGAVYQKGIMIGTDSSHFAPDQLVTRAQLALCLVRTFGLNYEHLQFIKEPLPSDLYDDVDNQVWYGDASMVMAYNNILKAEDRKFRPGQPITRREAAGAIADSFRAARLSVITTQIWPNYSDVDSLTDKERPALNFIYNSGIMKYPGSEFLPQQNITRAELATILAKTLNTQAVATAEETVDNRQ